MMNYKLCPLVERTVVGEDNSIFVDWKTDKSSLGKHENLNA